MVEFHEEAKAAARTPPMAIAGGALVIIQGWLADRFGLQLSFLLTAACEVYVLFDALVGSRSGVAREGVASTNRGS